VARVALALPRAHACLLRLCRAFAALVRLAGWVNHRRQPRRRAWASKESCRGSSCLLLAATAAGSGVPAIYVPGARRGWWSGGRVMAPCGLCPLPRMGSWGGRSTARPAGPGRSRWQRAAFPGFPHCIGHRVIKWRGWILDRAWPSRRGESPTKRGSSQSKNSWRGGNRGDQVSSTTTVRWKPGGQHKCDSGCGGKQWFAFAISMGFTLILTLIFLI
jgi:hypothetical protein